MMKRFFSWQKLKNSFRYAFEGLRAIFWEEQSFRIQLAVALILIFLMLIADWSYLIKAILVLSICLVLCLELINSQIERTLNLLHPAQHPEVKKIKDIAAAAVFVAVAGSAAIFLIFFVTKF
ncbi:MAG: diacylglycerol kinase [Candidatus Gribaldobacteria bacterium]|nr:diacylglycerol kinase [Candidatus Gribaldobacteria bacterium]